MQFPCGISCRLHSDSIPSDRVRQSAVRLLTRSCRKRHRRRAPLQSPKGDTALLLAPAAAPHRLHMRRGWSNGGRCGNASARRSALRFAALRVNPPNRSVRPQAMQKASARLFLRRRCHIRRAKRFASRQCCAAPRQASAKGRGDFLRRQAHRLYFFQHFRIARRGAESGIRRRTAARRCSHGAKAQAPHSHAARSGCRAREIDPGKTKQMKPKSSRRQIRRGRRGRAEFPVCGFPFRKNPFAAGQTAKYQGQTAAPQTKAPSQGCCFLRPHRPRALPAHTACCKHRREWIFSSLT